MTNESAPKPPRTVPHYRVAQAMELLFGPLPKSGADGPDSITSRGSEAYGRKAQDTEPETQHGPLIADQ